MKKHLLTFALLLGLLLCAVGVQAKVTIKLANSGPDKPDNRTVKAVDIFKHLVETGTNGEVEVTAFHASKLGAEREALEGIQMGTIQMGTLSGGPVPGFFPEVMIFDIPYLFTSNAAAWIFFHSPVAEKFKNDFLEKTGVRVLGITENGFRHFTNKKTPIKEPKDMQGLKVRTMQNPAHMAMVKSLGGDPTPIAFSELYMALQQGVVDAMECPIALIHDMKFYEVQNYMILDGHLYNPLFVFINDSFYQKLTPEQQKVVADAAEVLAMAHCGFNQEANISALQHLKELGMDVYKPSPEAIGAFREIAQPAGLEFIREKIGDEWVDQALADAQTAEQSVAGKEQQIVDEIIKKANEALAQVP